MSSFAFPFAKARIAGAFAAEIAAPASASVAIATAISVETFVFDFAVAWLALLRAPLQDCLFFIKINANEAIAAIAKSATSKIVSQSPV